MRLSERPKHEAEGEGEGENGDVGSGGGGGAGVETMVRLADLVPPTGVEGEGAQRLVVLAGSGS